MNFTKHWSVNLHGLTDPEVSFFLSSVSQFPAFKLSFISLTSLHTWWGLFQLLLLHRRLSGAPLLKRFQVRKASLRRNSSGLQELPHSLLSVLSARSQEHKRQSKTNQCFVAWLNEREKRRSAHWVEKKKEKLLQKYIYDDTIPSSLDLGVWRSSWVKDC